MIITHHLLYDDPQHAALTLDFSGNAHTTELKCSNRKAEFFFSPCASVSFPPKLTVRPCNGRNAKWTQPHVPLSCSVEATTQPFVQLKRYEELMSLLLLAVFSGVINTHKCTGARTNCMNTRTDACAPLRGWFDSKCDQDMRTLSTPPSFRIDVRSIM